MKKKILTLVILAGLTLSTYAAQTICIGISVVVYVEYCWDIEMYDPNGNVVEAEINGEELESEVSKETLTISNFNKELNGYTIYQPKPQKIGTKDKVFIVPAGKYKVKDGKIKIPLK